MTVPPSGSSDEIAGGACVRCGTPLAPATAHLSERGPVCWPCFEALQTVREQERGVVAGQQGSLDSRARRLAGVHGVMWGTAALVAGRLLPPAVATGALLLALALAVVLFMRKRWAYAAALVVDGAATLALAAWGVGSVGPVWPWLLTAMFSLSLIALTYAAREAFRLGPSPPSMSIVASWWARRPRWVAPAAVAVIVAGGAAVAVYVVTHQPDPAVTLMRARLTAWQVERGGPDSVAGGPAAQQLFAAARRWPAVAAAFESLDRAWPDEAPAHDAVVLVNRALRQAQLPYLVELWPAGDRPVVLGHRIVGQTPWRIGQRTVDVLRLRRVDTLNVDFAMAGVTDEGLPVVLVDRIEAFLARDVAAAYGTDRTERATRSLNDFDRAALTHLRASLERHLGAAMTDAGGALAERDRLLEVMRARLHGGLLQLADVPERFVLGDAWLASLKRGTKSTSRDGPMILDADLQQVAKADERLRGPALARTLDAIVELDARAVEAHEARHALDEIAAPGLPPPALFAVMEDSSTQMISSADRELRAFLGELHDGDLGVCATLARIMRSLYGRGAGRTAHSFAVIALLEQLDPKSELEPIEQMDALCRVPDADMRGRLERAWQTLYATPMPPAERGAPEAN